MDAKKKWLYKSWKDLKEIEMHISVRNSSENSRHCVIPIIWHSGKGKSVEIVKRSRVRMREKGIEGAQIILRGVKKSPYDSIMVDKCHTFAKIYRMYTTKNEP